MRCLLMLLLLTSSHSAAQELASDSSSLKVEAAKSREYTPEQRTNLGVLESARTEAGSLSPGLQVYSLVRIAEGYYRLDKPRAVTLMVEAFTVTQAIEDDPFDLRPSLQISILTRLFSWEPERAAALWEQTEAQVRSFMAEAMLKYKLDRKDYVGAADVVFKTMGGDRFPHGVVARLLRKLPPEMVLEREQLFLAAFDFAKRHPADNQAQFEDFGTLLLRSWQLLPPKLVLEAVDMLLEQSQRGRPEAVVISSRLKSVRFPTTYEYRAYQVLPILRQLDRDRADSLRRKLESVATAEKVSQHGFLQALEPEDWNRGDSPMGITSIGYSLPGGEEEAAERDTTMRAVNQRIADIQKTAVNNPREAIAMAGTLPEIISMRPAGYLPRLTALSSLGAILPARFPETRTTIVDEIYRNIARIPPEQQERFLEQAIRLAAAASDDGRIRTGILRGLQAAEALYKDDNDREDPNQEMKAYWPSAAAYQRFLFLEMKYLPEKVPDELELIRDEEIRGLSRIATALASLGMEELRPGSRVRKKSKRRGFTAPL